MLGASMGRSAAETIEATDPARIVADNEPATSTGEVAIVPEVALSEGDRAGDFVIDRILGRGTFGTVYAGVHAVIGRRAAIKVLRDHAASEDRVAAFLREARLVAKLRHPNIVDVLTYGKLEDGRHFQVMDLIEGPTLAEHLRERGALSITEALPILRGIAQALDAVHASGVAHRDLKPANVVLERRNGEWVPKLIDFGIAELIEGEADVAPERRSIGTPRYMSPEQCRGEAVDSRADVYAFGLLAYEMLAGQPAFAGSDAVDLMLKHTSNEPERLSSVKPTLSPRLDSVVLGLLAKNPEHRPTDLGAVVDQIAGAASPRSTRALVGAAAGVSLLVVAGAVMFRRGEPEREAAPSAAASVPVLSAPNPTEASAPTSASSPRASGNVPVAEASTSAPAASAPPQRIQGARPRAADRLPEPDPEAPENPFGGP